MELTGYHSTKSGNELVALKKYVDRVKEGQKDFFYIKGESVAQASSSPSIETLRKEEYEAVYIVNPVDGVGSPMVGFEARK